MVSYIHERINHQPIHSANASVGTRGIAGALAAYVCSAFSLARRLPRISPALRARAGRGQGDASNRGTESLANDPRSAHSLGRRTNPALAALGVSLSVIGCIYVGGVFGLFTALTRGLGDVDARFSEGATATYAAVTADHGAYGLTRGLAQLALLGIAVQAAALWRAPGIPRWATAAVAFGCALFLGFWDVDNLMFVGSLWLIAGFIPISRELRRLSAEI